MPLVDAKVSPLSVPAALIVVARPDGSATRRGLSETGDTTATALLSSAFDTARRKSEALIVWPDGYTADSVVVRLVLLPAAVTSKDRVLVPATNRRQFGVFRVLQPWESPALPKPNQPIPRYPSYNESHRIAGRLLLQFVVTAEGRVDPRTVSELQCSVC